MSSTFRLPLLLRCSSISFFVNTGKLSRDLHQGTSFEVFTVGFSSLSAMFDYCPPEPRFRAFARVIVTNAGKVYSFTSRNCFRPWKNSPFPLAQGIQLHERALDLIPCLIPCHRCEKSARESRQTHHFDQATWQHPRESQRHVRGSARIYDVRMAQFVLKIEKLSHIIGARGF